ncbi:YozE family protein [Filobacillus milosensis]|uniref:YozE family protein n=1 Tax=Filobacillus milosensis TaxID=94137 RepID=A0A4Y8IR35_9BACI|nr:YozE family protein [Filobacillus milosensis]TFB24016.1 YozE family protein [Filobacillus milosensis]
MKSFYHYMMAYRGIQTKGDPKKKLAEWMFNEHDFPKQSKEYMEISQYLEFHTPFPEALTTFDIVWEEYAQDN